MRKRSKGKKFSRTSDQRKAMFKTLATSLFLKEKIETTEAKAKGLVKLAEKTITKAKKNDLASKRSLAGLFSEKVIKKLFAEIGPRYRERQGGCTRIIKLGPRKTDGARMAIMELVK